MNNTNVIELWYLTDVDVSSYTGHYDMPIAYLFGLYLYNSWSTPDCGESYFESSLLLCISTVLSPFVNALAFGCILNC